VFEESHIWEDSNSKISQTTTTTFSARNSDLALILSTWHSLGLQLQVRRVTGLYLPANNIGTSYVTWCWYRRVLYHAHAWLQRLFKPHAKYGFHATAILRSNRRTSASGHYLPHVRPFAGKEQLTVRIFMIFRIQRLY